MADQHNDSGEQAKRSFFAKQQLVQGARTAFQQLAAVLRNSSLYPAAHPFLLSTAEKFVNTIETFFLERSEAAFYLVAGELFFETHSIPFDESIGVLIEELAGKDIGAITFKPGLMPSELISLARLLTREEGIFANHGTMTVLNAKETIPHIELHRVLVLDKKIESETGPEKKKVAAVFMDAVKVVKEMAQTVRLDKATSTRKMTSMVQTMVDSILENPDTFIGLTNIKMYDEYTFAHSVNTAILAVSLGAFLSLQKPQIAALGVAGLLHDIGKVTVPVEIINKPGILTEEEWEQIRRHPIEGALILSVIPGITKLAMIAAFEHHQHGDQRSYPRIDDVVQQHPFSQIVALADAYDALTAARVYYKSQMPPDKAIRILVQKRGSVFEPTLVKAFVNMIGVFPVGTILKLDTGEVGLVVQQTADLLRPRILLLTKFDGSEKENGKRISLLETAGGRYKRAVAGTINPHEIHLDVKQYLT